jgi:DNA polymerase III epsilon subunit family exonuclease
MNLVIFDLETTGFSPRANDIIQIAAVRMRDGEVVAEETFASYVRPRRGVPGFITEINGVTNDDVRDAPEPAAVLRAFSEFVGDATLVAHNGWRFDLGFIRETCQRHAVPTREVPFVDSLALSRRVWGGANSHNLDAVMERLGISGDDLRRHDARDDVRILAEAVRQMWRQLGATNEECPVPVEIGHLPQLN